MSLVAQVIPCTGEVFGGITKVWLIDRFSEGKITLLHITNKGVIHIVL